VVELVEPLLRTLREERHPQIIILVHLVFLVLPLDKAQQEHQTQSHLQQLF
jgi:hypothetical protein